MFMYTYVNLFLYTFFGLILWLAMLTWCNEFSCMSHF